MTPARPLAASVAALGIAGVVGIPAPATAAPAPCERAEHYAAQSGAELLHINRLTLGSSKDSAGDPAKDRTSGAGSPAGTAPGKHRTTGTGTEQGKVSAVDGGNPTTGGEDGDRPADGSGASGKEASQPTPATKEGTARPAAVGGSPGAAERTEAGGKAGAGDRDAPGLRGTLGDLGKVTGLTDGSAGRADLSSSKGSVAGKGKDSGSGDGTGTVPGSASDTGGGSGTGPASAGTGDGKDAGEDGAARPGATATGAPAAGGPAGEDEQDPDQPTSATVRDVRVGEAKSALVAVATPNSAAVTRMLNSSQVSKLSDPLVQQAPPTNARPGRRDTPAAAAGPLLLDAGTSTVHAQWAAGMACGATAGKVTRAAATLGAAQVMGVGDDVLLAVPAKAESVSTTALEQRGSGARTVAGATIDARTFELLGGAVTVKVVRLPTLETRMSTLDGGEVAYVPATLEVSGTGMKTTTLDTAGDMVELIVSDRPRTESGGLPKMDGLRAAPPLPLPSVPGLPPLSAPHTESAPATGPGTHVRISLGDVRQAALGHSVAARASAITIVINEGGPEGRAGEWYGGNGPGMLLDLEVGVLESAAVAPEPNGGDVAGAVAGAGGGLPLTGPRVDLLAIGGVALLAAGAAAMAFGVRRRRFRA